MEFRKKRGITNYSRTAYIMLLPFLLLFIVTLLIPAVMSLGFSFSKVSTAIEFIGLENFIAIFKDPLFLNPISMFSFLCFFPYQSQSS